MLSVIHICIVISVIRVNYCIVSVIISMVISVKEWLVLLVVLECLVLLVLYYCHVIVIVIPPIPKCY